MFGFLSTLGRGLMGGIRGVGQGIGKLANPGEEDTGGFYGTPGWNPDASMPYRAPNNGSLFRTPDWNPDANTPYRLGAPNNGNLFRTPDWNPSAGMLADNPAPRPTAPINPTLLNGGTPLTGTRTAPEPLPAPPSSMPPLAPSSAAPPAIPPTSPGYLPTLKDYRGRAIYDPYSFEKDQYMREGMNDQGGFNRSPKSIALNALLGGLRGLSTGQGAGAGLGGAIAGGLGATISPRLGRENMFNTFRAPEILENEGRQRAQQDYEAQQAMGALKRQDILAGIGLKQANAIKAARENPFNVPRGGAAINPRTGQVIYQSTEPQKPVTLPAGGTLVNPETGKTIATGTPRTGANAWRLTTGPDGKPMWVDLNAAGNQGKQFQGYQKSAREQSNAQINMTTRNLARLKGEAESAWAKWGQFMPGIDLPGSKADQVDKVTKERMKSTASAAQQRYNSAVQEAGKNYPDYFETQMDENGWQQYRQKAQAPQSGSAKPLGGPGGGASTSRPRSAFSSDKFPGLIFD